MENLLNTYKEKYNLEYYDCDEEKFLEILKFEYFPELGISNFLNFNLRHCFSLKKIF